MAVVHGTAKSETINAFSGVTGEADFIFGRGGNDRIYGLGGNDEIWGGHGADYIDGGSGIDTANYSDSAEGVTVILRTGIRGFNGTAAGDTLVNIENLTGSAHGDTLIGDDIANVLRGMGGHDVIEGNAGADTIYGGIGNDFLDADSGNDIVDGGTGSDAMLGGSDGDRFVWAVVEDTSANADTADQILDFNFPEGDRIDLAAIDADLVAAGNQAFTFIGSAALSGTPGEINFIHTGGDTLIQLQTGTSADPEAVILLPGILTPEASWFVL